MTNDPVTQALAELHDLVRCRCHPAYTGRGLHDPDCNCDNAEAVKMVADRIEAQAAEIEWYRDRVVWGLYEDETPKFYQGKEGEHEICEPVSAKEVSNYISEIERLNTQCEGLFQAAMNNGQALIIAEDKLAKAQGALHQIAGKKDYADDPWCIARAALAELTGGKDD